MDALSTTYNRNAVVLRVYTGYKDAGRAKKQVIKDYAKRKNVSLNQLILEALKRTYPDIGL